MRHLSYITTKARPISKPSEIEAAVAVTKTCEPRVKPAILHGNIVLVAASSRCDQRHGRDQRYTEFIQGDMRQRRC
jgi:hypothetical protein